MSNSPLGNRQGKLTFDIVANYRPSESNNSESKQGEASRYGGCGIGLGPSQQAPGTGAGKLQAASLPTSSCGMQISSILLTTVTAREKRNCTQEMYSMHSGSTDLSYVLSHSMHCFLQIHILASRQTRMQTPGLNVVHSKSSKFVT